MNDQKSIIELVRELKKATGMLRPEIAERLGVSKVTLWIWCRDNKIVKGDKERKFFSLCKEAGII